MRQWKALRRSVMTALGALMVAAICNVATPMQVEAANPTKITIVGTAYDCASDWGNPSTDSIYYTASDNTLTLNNATIESSGKIGIEVTTGDLNIKLIGSNRIDTSAASNKAAIRNSKYSVSITGETGASLTAITSGHGITAGQNVTVNGCTLCFTIQSSGAVHGIYAGGDESSVSLQNSDVTITGTGTNGYGISLRAGAVSIENTTVSLSGTTYGIGAPAGITISGLSDSKEITISAATSITYNSETPLTIDSSTDGAAVITYGASADDAGNQSTTISSLPYSYAANSSIFASKYLKIANAVPSSDTPINSVDITGISEPVSGGALGTTASCTTEGVASISAITWSPADTTAASNTVYAATVTLTPSEGYAFSAGTTLPAVGGVSPTIKIETDGKLKATYTFPATAKDKVVAPTASVASGSYKENQSVTLTTTTADATIYYTMDGSTPTIASTQYTGAIEVTGTKGEAIKKEIKAIAVKDGMDNSAVSAYTYIIRIPADQSGEEPDGSTTKVGDDDGSGNLTVAAKIEEAPKTTVATSAKEILSILEKDGTLSGGDLDSVKKGEADVEVILSVNGSDSSVEQAAKDLIKAKADTESLTMAKYMDITLTKYIIPVGKTISQVDGTRITQLTNGNIAITVTIPEDIRDPEDPTKTRVFYMLRKHNDKVTVLNGTTSSDGTEFTFETNQFSDYGLAYKDVDRKSDKADGNSYHHHTHVYEWEVYQKATATTDGIMRYRCKVCGTVEYEVPVTAYYVFNKETQEAIWQAAPNATVKVQTPIFISFHEMVKEALAARPDVTLVVDYKNAGKSYEMTIPAGSGAQLDTLFGDSKFAGFLYLGGAFATVAK